MLDRNDMVLLWLKRNNKYNPHDSSSQNFLMEVPEMIYFTHGYIAKNFPRVCPKAKSQKNINE